MGGTDQLQQGNQVKESQSYNFHGVAVLSARGNHLCVTPCRSADDRHMDKVSAVINELRNVPGLMVDLRHIERSDAVLVSALIAVSRAADTPPSIVGVSERVLESLRLMKIEGFFRINEEPARSAESIAVDQIYLGLERALKGSPFFHPELCLSSPSRPKQKETVETGPIGVTEFKEDRTCVVVNRVSIPDRAHDNHTLDEFEACIRLAREAEKPLSIDLTKVLYLGEEARGFLVTLAAREQQAGRRMQLTGVNKGVAERLSLLGAPKLMDILPKS